MVGFLNALGQFGTNAVNGYQNMDQWLAAKQDAEMKAQVAKAYGQAMQSMAAPPPPINAGPLGGSVQPQAPDFTMQNFVRALPQGIDPQAAGMAANQFLPMVRQDQLNDYRAGQLGLGSQRLDATADYRNALLGQGDRRLDQGDTRISLAQQKFDLNRLKEQTVQAFREKRLQVEQASPQVKLGLDRLRAELASATQLANAAMYGEGSGSKEYAGAMQRLSDVQDRINQYDLSGQNLPMPAAPKAAMPSPAPQGLPPAAAPKAAMPPSVPQAPAVTAQPPAPNIPPGSIEELKADPTLAPMFEKTFGLPPGAANKYLGKGGPVMPMEREASLNEKNMLSVQKLDPQVKARIVARQNTREDINAANAALQKPNLPMEPNTPARYPTAPNEPPPIDSVGFGADTRAQAAAEQEAEKQTLTQKLSAAGLSVAGMKLPELRLLDKANDVDNSYDAAATVARGGLNDVQARMKKRGITPGSRPVASLRPSGNPYMGMDDRRRMDEMRRLSIQMSVAKTQGDRLAVKRKLDQLFEAGAVPKQAAGM